MFIVFLKFSDNKELAGKYMDGHKAWIKQGFDDGIFLMAGSLQQPHKGGSLFVHNTSLADLENRIKGDPFVAKNVVTPEIIEVTPSKLDERLAFINL